MDFSHDVFGSYLISYLSKANIELLRMTCKTYHHVILNQGLESVDIVKLSISTGDVDLLTFLHNRLKYTLESHDYVASNNGHLACLKYLHENGCPWDSLSTCDTALNGHLECLK